MKENKVVGISPMGSLKNVYGAKPLASHFFAPKIKEIERVKKTLKRFFLKAQNKSI